MTASPLSLSWQANFDTLPTSTQPHLVYLLVEMSPGRAKTGNAPVNLALVVDASPSMRIRLATQAQFEDLVEQGLVQEVMTDGVPSWRVEDVPREVLRRLPRKVDFVMAALQTAVEQLRPADRFSLVAFAKEAQTIISNTSGREKRRLYDTIPRLDKLDLGDDTIMAPGLALAWAEVEGGAGPGLVSRLILLTDGFTRDGSRCQPWIDQARHAGVAISTLGMGGDFNEALLIPMTENTGGNAYYVPDVSALPDIFRRELAAAQAVTHRRVELKVQHPAGVSLRQAHRVQPAISQLPASRPGADSTAFFLGDLGAESGAALLLEFVVQPRPVGRFRLATLVLDSDPVDQRRQHARQDVELAVAAADQAAGPVNGRVMNLVEAVSAYQLHNRALADIESGRVQAATQKLEAAATRLLSLGEPELARTMQLQAHALEQGGALDAQATKKLRYETRRLTKREQA